MNNDLARICLEVVVAEVKVGLLSWHLPGGTEEKQEKAQSQYPASGLSEPRTLLIRSRSANHSTAMFIYLVKSKLHEYNWLKGN
jgi:hypothetical protein